ncbi:hypothetical protein [Flagellimonas sp.]|uniref:hypothetical protein n=1 Tax=Flagellimonas sp. TaxID=2058762 RepID=UPI003B59C7CE
MKNFGKSCILGFTILIQTVVFGQKNGAFQTPKSLVNETQRIISVEAGQKIDTAYFKTLFLPTAHFTVVGKENGNFAHETMDLNTFVESLTDEYYTNGYHEESTGEIIEEYNGIAQVIQSFEGMDSENETGKGVGTYQLIFSEGRWWIANMVWTMSYNDGKDIPAKYLKH